MTVDADRIRVIDPLVTPQYPFDEAPKTPERSEARYASLTDYEARIPMRDGQVYEFPIEIGWPATSSNPATACAWRSRNHDSVISADGRPHVTIRNKATTRSTKAGARPRGCWCR